jgi:Tfp pilus assembly protein PilF
MAVATRSMAQLFVNLTERIQFDMSAGPRQRLRLFIGPAEQPYLTELLSADVKAGRLPAEALFTSAQRDQTLPVYPRLSLLEAAAVQEDKFAPDRRCLMAGLRTELLAAMGRYNDALSSADKGFELLEALKPEPQGVRGLLWFLRANSQRQLGQVDAALHSFKNAAEEAAKPRPDGSIDYHNRGVCLAEAGHCHAERKEWAQAAALLRDGIAALRQSQGDQRVRDEQLAQLEQNLKICEAQQQAASTPAGG